MTPVPPGARVPKGLKSETPRETGMRRSRAFLTTLWALLFAILATALASAQAKPESLFDFSASVQSLAAAAEKGVPLPVGRYVLITGTLRSLEAQDESTLSVRLEIASGEWEGTSRVILRTVYVECSGEGFRSLTDRDSPDRLRPGSTILAMGRVLGVRIDPEGTPRVWLEGVHVRSLD